MNENELHEQLQDARRLLTRWAKLDVTPVFQTEMTCEILDQLADDTDKFLGYK